MLPLDRRDDILDGQLSDLQLVRIDPDAQVALEKSAQEDFTHAADRLKLILQVVLHVLHQLALRHVA